MTKFKSVSLNSKNLANFLNDLKITYENDVNYNPLELTIDFDGITPDDIGLFIEFLKEP